MIAHDTENVSGISTEFRGHGEAEATLLRMARSGRMPHAILLSGRRGIGKATLALNLARWLLAGGGNAGEGQGMLLDIPPAETGLFVDPNHPVAKRVAAGGHADLLRVERAWDPKKKRIRSEIIVDDVRSIADFFHMTPAEGGWRIAIIDEAEEMNRSSANAVLKILEEPPARCLLLLVSHNAGRLLPTIRSRCRLIMLQPLPDAVVTGLLAELRPEITDDDRQICARLGAGSIGKALDIGAAGGIDLYRAMMALLAGLPRLDIPTLHALADRVGRGDSTSYDMLAVLLLDLIARLTTSMSGQAGQALPPDEGGIARNLTGRCPLDRWAVLWENLRQLFERAAAVNLDRKQVVLNAFLAVEATAAS